MSTNPDIDKALQYLRKRGHKVTTNPGTFVHPDGKTRISVDGKLLTHDEIFEMVSGKSSE